MDVDVEVVTDNTGLTGDALRTPVKEDHARGLHPFLFGEYFSGCIFLTLANCTIAQLLRLRRHRPVPLIRWPT